MNACTYCGKPLPPAPTDQHRQAILTVHKPVCSRWPSLDDLVNEAESLQGEVIELGNKVWDFIPMLPECEGPIDALTSAIDNMITFLAEQKSANPT